MEFLINMLRVLYVPIQCTLIVLLFYFMWRVLILSYTLSPSYKGRVPYVPTKRKLIKKAFEMLELEDDDKVVDLGCGEGNFLVYASKRSRAHFTGIELQGLLYLIAKIRTALSSRNGRIEVVKADYFKMPLDEYTKVFMFNMPSVMKNLVPKLAEELTEGTKVVSIIFPIESRHFVLKDTFTAGKDSVFLYERAG